LLNYPAATSTGAGSGIVTADGPATTANDQRLHREQLPRIGHAAKRPLNRRDDLPA
jgi:hypothetical protein